MSQNHGMGFETLQENHTSLSLFGRTADDMAISGSNSSATCEKEQFFTNTVADKNPFVMSNQHQYDPNKSFTLENDDGISKYSNERYSSLNKPTDDELFYSDQNLDNNQEKPLDTFENNGEST